MGTSQSSNGSPSGVPMVPPWVPDALDTDDPDSGEPSPLIPPDSASPLAPPRRFGSSRTSLGNFASSGSINDMKRGLGHYVRTGLGGATTATRRFGGTSRTAGVLYGALSAVAGGRAPSDGSPLDPTILQGRSAYDVMDAVMEAVRPIDGTQDTEVSRKSIHTALSEVLERFPDADLLNLTEIERLFAIERYVALDVYARVRLDVGKAVRDKAPSATAALSRLREVKEYVKEEISASFRQLRTAGQNLTGTRITRMIHEALQITFRVFEEYVK